MGHQSSKEIVKLESEESFKTFISQDSLTLVGFYGDQTAPCSKFDPILEKLARDSAASVTVGRVNASKLFRLSMEQDIEFLPTLIFYINGHMVDKVEGTDKVKVRKAIKKLNEMKKLVDQVYY